MLNRIKLFLQQALQDALQECLAKGLLFVVLINGIFAIIIIANVAFIVNDNTLAVWSGSITFVVWLLALIILYAYGRVKKAERQSKAITLDEVTRNIEIGLLVGSLVLNYFKDRKK